MRNGARGFTLIELLVVVTIIGILSSIAIPKFRAAKRRATATQIVGDFDVVRHAAISFSVDSGYFPAEAGPGAVPRNLTQYLPNGFQFTKDNWMMDYENWPAGGVAVIGVSFQTRDAMLGATALSLLGNSPSFTSGSKYTIVISGM